MQIDDEAIVDFSTYSATHSDEECLTWLKQKQLRKHLHENVSVLLFCCIVNGRFQSLQYLLNQFPIISSEHTAKNNTNTKMTNNTPNNPIILSSPIISTTWRTTFLNTADDTIPSGLTRLRTRFMSRDHTTTSIGCHYIQVVRNSGYKMLSHCLLDYLLFDCSRYKSSICLTDDVESSWFDMYQDCADGRYFMESYYVPKKIEIGEIDGIDTSSDIESEWFDSCINYNFEMECKDENNLQDIKKQLEAGIEIYKQLLEKHPSIQFLTTFCRELPHLYGEALLNQSYIKPLIEKKNKCDKNDEEEQTILSYESYQFTNDCQRLFEELFDKYAHLNIDDFVDVDERNIDTIANQEKSSKQMMMSVGDARNYMFSCGGRYVLIYTSIRSIHVCICFVFYTNVYE